MGTCICRQCAINSIRSDVSARRRRMYSIMFVTRSIFYELQINWVTIIVGSH